MTRQVVGLCCISRQSFFFLSFFFREPSFLCATHSVGRCVIRQVSKKDNWQWSSRSGSQGNILQRGGWAGKQASGQPGRQANGWARERGGGHMGGGGKQAGRLVSVHAGR